MNKCKFCNGKGYNESKVKLNEGFLGLLPLQNFICKKCQGTGELDWVEEITGKRLSIARRIISHDRVHQELKKRVVEYEHKQNKQAFYERCVPV